MGLDAVEIVMAIEEAFDIQIEDAVAECLLTPRDVIDFVALKTSRSQTFECLTQRAFNQLRAGFIHHAKLDRRKVKPKTRISELIARDGRRRIIRQILSELGVVADPHFVRPGWLIGLVFIGSVALGIVGTLAVRTYDVFYANPFFLIPAIALLCAWLALWMTRGMRYELDAAVATVGGLARWLVARGPSFIAIEPGKWTREQIAERVREVVIAQLGCAKSYREDARFIEDLGVG